MPRRSRHATWFHRTIARLHGRLVVASTVVALAACGGGNGTTTPAPAATTGTTPVTTTPVVTVVPDPVPARKSNATCKAFSKPEEAGVLAPYPNLPSFDLPVSLVASPVGIGRWFVVEKGGLIKSIPANDPNITAATIALDITGKVNANNGEAGLLNVAFHPSFATNRYAYVMYNKTYTAPTTPVVGAPVLPWTPQLSVVISRFTVSADGLTFNPASEQVILTYDKPFENHNGGFLQFGPDGYLYIGSGDGGGGQVGANAYLADPYNASQDTMSLLGKLLRIDVTTPPPVGSALPYVIPVTNPLSTATGANVRKEIFALGFRNPWRGNFEDDGLWIGDVGESEYEEINKVATTPGVAPANYGWSIKEGSACFRSGTCADPANAVSPSHAYTHSGGRCAITGGVAYKGTALPKYQNQLLYADFCTGEILAKDRTTGAAATLLTTKAGMPVAFARDALGEVYFIDMAYQGIRKLASAAATGGGNVPLKLSETGCMKAGAPTQFASGVITYDVNTALWTDNAAKERAFAVPDGTSVAATSQTDATLPGHWNFPAGSVLIKHFKLAGKYIETRLLVRDDSGDWGGYSYEWNDAQTDATLLLDGATKVKFGQGWIYPSSAQCMRCHTGAAGRTIGPESAQVNMAVQNPAATGKTINQSDMFSRMGLVSGLGTSLPALAAIDDTTQSLSVRARSYLHANCAYCHRPNGGTPTDIDLRYTTALKDTRTCNVKPMSATTGLAGTVVIAPGNPTGSILLGRLAATGANAAMRMPPLGSNIVHTAGTTLISDWIKSLTSCN